MLQPAEALSVTIEAYQITVDGRIIESAVCLLLARAADSPCADAADWRRSPP